MQTLNHSALLLIEFQNEWLSEQGKIHHLLSDKKQFEESVKQAKQALAAARAAHFPIIHSGLAFNPGYKELGQAEAGLRYRIQKAQTFIAGTPGVEFPEPFSPRPHEFLVSGRIGSSAFSGSNLDLYLRNQGIKKLYIMGYALHVCVESTMRAAHDLGYDVVIIEDACAAFNQAQKDHVHNTVIPHFGSGIQAQDFINLLGK
jgi:nicotinamidase-related amidase